ncbi:hypothetical protein ACMD2_14538 [Ananas comosus]|uniref:Uncharacterized protein n=1 Tax=Ananas comosus TaxID=4615 RepID=A0A199W070_ANACO|nr:hypothetical protein ACMD2_14538 [Ananas comosus]
MSCALSQLALELRNLWDNCSQCSRSARREFIEQWMNNNARLHLHQQLKRALLARPDSSTSSSLAWSSPL